MKQQTFLVRIYSNDNQTTFERFNCKKAETARKQFTQLLNNSLYASLLKMDKANKAICYATPDGYNTESVVWEMEV